MASTTSGLVTNTSEYEKLGLTPVGRELIFGLTTPPSDSNEDCLTLNIWTKPQVGEAKKAVLMFIYGGGYVSGKMQAPPDSSCGPKAHENAGGSSVPWYDGATLAHED